MLSDFLFWFKHFVLSVTVIAVFWCDQAVFIFYLDCSVLIICAFSFGLFLMSVVCFGGISL